MQSKTNSKTKSSKKKSKTASKSKPRTRRKSPKNFEILAAKLANDPISYYKISDPFGQLTKEVIREAIEFNLKETPERLRVKVQAPECPAFEAQIIRLIISSSAYADANMVDFLYKRMIGNVEAKLTVTKVNVYESMTEDELERKHAELKALNAPPSSDFIDVTPLVVEDLGDEPNQGPPPTQD